MRAVTDRTPPRVISRLDAERGQWPR